MIKITYFVHGTTTDNIRSIATGWLPGKLSPLGVQQAKDLTNQTSHLKFDAVFCSDLKRAVSSARLAFGDRYEIITDRRLREINYGNFNGQDESFKSDLTKYITKSFLHGESYHDVEKRIADFLNFLKQDYDGKHIAIMSHQAPQLALEVLVNGKTWQQAIAEDWRRTKSWQPGWEYILK